MVSKELVEAIEKKALQLREDIVDMIGVGKVGHLGGSCSCADIVAALYFHKMKVDPKNPTNENRDRFLLSKGHAALVQYAALAELGHFPKDELKKVKTLGSMLQGHPDMTKTPGIEANTGSLGQGLSIANGMALGLRLDGKKNKVYVIIGDGELAEGQIWEAAMAAANFKIDNLVAIVDRNKLQATGPIKERFDTNPIAPKWEAFGWNVIEIDGHNVEQIIEALDKADEVKGKPTVIIAETIKGKYISFAENNAAFHNGAMTQEQYETAKKDLEKLKV
ncbi:MAG: transketolase [Petroclostridium sp.]|jgi:transketolase|uniref:transketolase n=1 Tax=Petroclostridium xylanilyticum TaxID=1792311 RepID=UPI000B995C53|nr:transketolase [Petroclostridium xylanilyticum]MBZ4645964.1 transketolase subunit [Clostridia bacterium]MDK2809611.1 transketolase [Petroclostridium sp.]